MRAPQLPRMFVVVTREIPAALGKLGLVAIKIPRGAVPAERTESGDLGLILPPGADASAFHFIVPDDLVNRLRVLQPWEGAGRRPEATRQAEADAFAAAVAWKHGLPMFGAQP